MDRIANCASLGKDQYVAGQASAVVNLVIDERRYSCCLAGHIRILEDVYLARALRCDSRQFAWFTVLVAPVRSDGITDFRQCDVALRDAAAATGVPVWLLLALAPIESGVGNRTGQIYPWPWTLNINGRGSYHFRSRAAAERHLDALIAAGIDNVDIGCLQVNWHWHRSAFASPAAVLSPALNVQYAASLLRKYRAQTGTWSGAIGLYHNHDARLADVYRCRAARVLTPTATIRGCAVAAPSTAQKSPLPFG
jgi:hypothetical protein